MSPLSNLGKTCMRNLVLGTAGHIDHGKTSLVRALTGVDTDRLPEEKQRGITIDLGFASMELGQTRLAIVDVPGHERFIRNMLAGASGVDLAMLVVAADDTVMPQTREHLEILKLLRLAGGVIALTKSDLVEPEWLAMAEEDLRGLVAGTFLEGCAIVRTSVVRGEGIEALRAELVRICERAPGGSNPGLFRMAVDRSFTVTGHGTVVTGTVVSGAVSVGDELEWQPTGRMVRVRGLHRHDRDVERVERGCRAAINVVGVHHTEIRRGHELAAPGYLRASQLLAVEVVESAESERRLRHRGRYKLHLGTAEVSAVLSLLVRDEVAPGEVRLGQLFVAEAIVATHGQPFVLRAESPPATVGGGRVLQVEGRRYRRRDAGSIARLGRLRSEDGVERLRAVLAFLGMGQEAPERLAAMAGLALVDVDRALAILRERGEIVELAAGGRRRVTMLVEHVAELEDRVLRALARLHAARPRHSVIPRTHLAAELPDLANDTLVAAILERLQVAGKIVGDARAVRLRDHVPKLSQGERKLKEELAGALRAGGISPPEVSELTAHAGTRGAAVADLLALLRDEERVVEINPEVYLDIDIETEMRRKVNERLADGSAITMAELRDLLGTTRRYAVPIGEYLDRVGATRREGDVRRAVGSS